MTAALDRMGSCPQCGAPIAFRFASAQAQVCAHCRYVVIRTDRNLQALGRIAEIVAIPSPYQVGTTGSAYGQAFRIGGRIQYDRVEAASAPWQEQFIEWDNGNWSWLAQAQGRIYLTSLYQGRLHLPSYTQALPGTPITLGTLTLYVTERGARRLVTGEGELPFAIRPGIVEWYADLSGPGGAFGTIDYGDGSSPPLLYVGQEVPPPQIQLHASFGPPLEAPQVRTRALVCPGCGGNLPLVAPETAERVVCTYCQLASDVTQQGLVGVQQLRKLYAEPQIPLGSQGKLRGLDVTCIAFLVRKTFVEGERYFWREYLLYAEKAGYLWLLEEDENWQFIRPIAPGDVRSVGSSRSYAGVTYQFQQSNTAVVDHVVGEMYWKVEVGEEVQATEWKCGKQRLSEERTENEVVMSHSEVITSSELKKAFASTKLKGRLGQKEYEPSNAWFVILPALLLGWFAIAVGSCVVQADETLYRDTLLVPTTIPSLDDDEFIVAGKSCASWRAAVVDDPDSSLPAGCQPAEADRSIFTPPFEISRDRKNLRIELEAPNLDNSWVGADLALIDDENGDVYERTIDFEYYSGVEGGESWSEGSRSDVVWFTRIPKGRYLVRLDPEWDPLRPRPTLRMHVQSDTPRWSYAFWAFAGIVIVGFIGISLDVKWQTRPEND